MHLRYEQSTGRYSIIHEDGSDEILGYGWAGHGKWKNDPYSDGVKGCGPLPRGWYDIGEPEYASTGPFSLRLYPDKSNDMHGRDSFLIHGPALTEGKYGEESRGCPIAVRPLREEIHARGIKRLEVVR